MKIGDKVEVINPWLTSKGLIKEIEGNFFVVRIKGYDNLLSFYEESLKVISQGHPNTKVFK